MRDFEVILCVNGGKKHETEPGVAGEKCEMQSAALRLCLMMAATHLPTTHTRTHTHHVQYQTTTFRMRSYLLLEKNGEGNKRKRKDYFGVADGEKKM